MTAPRFVTSNEVRLNARINALETDLAAVTASWSKRGALLEQAHRRIERLQVELADALAELAAGALHG